MNSEADTLSEGTLRTALLKAAALRHQNAFSLIKIEFENSVKKIRLQKNALPSLDAGFVSIDCASRVTMDASQVEDKKAVLVLDSHSNQIKGCEFTHFQENGILVLGNENILQNNRFTQSIKAYGIVLRAQASHNKITNNIFENLDTAIRLVSNTGWGNEFSQNFFKQISRKEIENNASRWDSSRINLKRLSGSASEIEIIGSLNEEVVLELYYSNNEKQWLPLTQKKVQVQSQSQEGEFKTLFNISGIAPQNSFAVLATATRKNTSDFSNSLTHVLAKPESTTSLNPSLTVETPKAEHPKEEIKETVQKEIISEEDQNKDAMKDSTKEVPKVDPLFNSTKLPGFEATPPASEINIQSNKKSGPSDSFKVEILDGP